MLKRLQAFSAHKKYKTAWMSAWGAKSSLQRFLAWRCSKEFLSLFIDADSSILTNVSSPGLMLNAVSEVDLAVRLHEFGLLPDDTRKKFIAAVGQYAVTGQDLYALQDDDLQSVFKEDELDELVGRVQTELLPQLGDVRRKWEADRPGDQPADEHMQPLLDSFDTLKRVFGDEEGIVETVDREAERASEWIAENMPEDDDDEPRRSLATSEAENVVGRTEASSMMLMSNTRVELLSATRVDGDSGSDADVQNVATGRKPGVRRELGSTALGLPSRPRRAAVGPPASPQRRSSAYPRPGHDHGPRLRWSTYAIPRGPSPQDLLRFGRTSRS